MRKPKVFLLDEPLSNLDAKLRLGTRVEIAKLHRQLGTTMIYVTHDQIEAMTLGHRIVVMDRGEVQQIDTPMNLYRAPANVFVAGFLGSPAMNFFAGRVTAGDGTSIAIGKTLLRVARDEADAIAKYNGHELIVGVRPEDLMLAANDATDATTLEARLEVVEPVGNEIFLNLRYGDAPLVMRIPPQEIPATGSTLRVAIKPGRWHLFDAASERRIDVGEFNARAIAR